MPKQRERKRQQNLVIKIPTSLLTASPQQALVALLGLGCKDVTREGSLAKDKRDGLKLDVEGTARKNGSKH